MKSSHYVQKSRISKFIPFAQDGCLFMWGTYYCMGCDVVVVIKMGAYIHGVLIIPILRYEHSYGYSFFFFLLVMSNPNCTPSGKKESKELVTECRLTTQIVSATT